MKPSANRLAAIDLMLRTGDLVRRNTSAAFADGTLTDVEVNRSLEIIDKHKQQIAAIENELMNGPASVKTANGGTFIKRMAM
jgi:hypothetical protein